MAATWSINERNPHDKPSTVFSFNWQSCRSLLPCLTLVCTRTTTAGTSTTTFACSPSRAQSGQKSIQSYFCDAIASAALPMHCNEFSNVYRSSCNFNGMVKWWGVMARVEVVGLNKLLMTNMFCRST